MRQEWMVLMMKVDINYAQGVFLGAAEGLAYLTLISALATEAYKLVQQGNGVE